MKKLFETIIFQNDKKLFDYSLAHLLIYIYIIIILIDNGNTLIYINESEVIFVTKNM